MLLDPAAVQQSYTAAVIYIYMYQSHVVLLDPAAVQQSYAAAVIYICMYESYVVLLA